MLVLGMGTMLCSPEITIRDFLHNTSHIFIVGTLSKTLLSRRLRGLHEKRRQIFLVSIKNCLTDFNWELEREIYRQ